MIPMTIAFVRLGKNVSVSVARASVLSRFVTNAILTIFATDGRDPDAKSKWIMTFSNYRTRKMT